MSKNVLGFPLSDGLCPEPSRSLYFAYIWMDAPYSAVPQKGPCEYLGRKGVAGAVLLRNLLGKQPAPHRTHIGAALILKQCMHQSHPNDPQVERVGMYVNAAQHPGRRTSHPVSLIEASDGNDLGYAQLSDHGIGVPNVVIPPVTDTEAAAVIGRIVLTETSQRTLYVAERGPIVYVPFGNIMA